ncbi:hypothetical protein SAMN06265348_10651 [Pedobacter westerhofensis]|uniref:Uncharacterized protein n=1 Tax=Pedobacter westerhofensis TaxID=425512 RepID=A0A521DP55_9SPHI|nr:hypothetical protein [Pedobacter westerhofensis]SMO73382.1 hypothetical protein SAMN06265348_10651 [Pedobacter westerhofensis]
MEETHNQRLPNTTAKETRGDNEDIISGARNTDQLEKLQQKVKENPARIEHKEGTPAVVIVNNGGPEQNHKQSIGKPLSAKGHALMDYALVASLLLVPHLLGMNKNAKRIYAAEALTLLPYVALTKQPFSIKGLIPFSTHGKIDLFNVSQFALQTLFKPFRSSKKELIFNLSFTAIAGLTVLLTDWKQQQPAKS